MDNGGSKLAFVVGHYKSGTTWLVNLLSLHPDIRGVAETHVFRYATGSTLEDTTFQLFHRVSWSGGGWSQLPRHRVAKWVRPLRVALGKAPGQAGLSARERPTTRHDLAVRDQLAIRRLLGKAADPDDYLRTFFSFLEARLAPGRYLVEKTPTNAPYIPKIKELFPKAKLVAIYRDGRDVVISDKFHLARTYGTEEPLEVRVNKWKNAVESHLRYEEEHDVFTMAYEEMLADPQTNVGRLLEYLGMDVPAAVLEDMIHRSSFKFVTGRKEGQEDRKGFYRKGVAGDWQNHFSDEERAEFARLAGDLLVRLGYEESADPSTWGAETARSG